MSYEERKQAILGELAFCNQLSFHEIEKIVDAAPTTIRRDLARMAEEGVIERYHGGVKIGSEVAEYSMRQKQAMHSEEKRLLGQEAARVLAPNELVFIGGGSTTYSMIEFIEEASISVITNSLPHAESLHRRGIRTFLLCGFLRTRTRCLGGAETVRLMREYHFDRSFIGAGGIGSDLRILSADQSEYEIKEAALELSRHTYVLADASKFGLTAMYHSDFLSHEGATLITDNPACERDDRIVVVRPERPCDDARPASR